MAALGLWAVAFVAAELCSAFISPSLGAAVHTVLVLAAVNHNALTSRGDSEAGLALAIAVASLSRLLSIALPLSGVSPVARLAALSAPVFVSAALALAVLQIGPRTGLGMPPRSWRDQLAIGLAGVPLSATMYLVVGRNSELFNAIPRSLSGVALTGVVVVFVALVEEIVFRGLIHHAAKSAVGRASVPVSTALFASAYSGYRSVPVLLVVAAFGLLAALAREHTGSIVGATLAHATVNLGVFIVWPHLLG